MIRSFRNQGTEDVFNGKDSKAARMVCPADVVRAARRRQDAQGCGRPVLLRMETQGSHGYIPTDKQIAEAADILAFAVENLGPAPDY